MKGVAHFPTYPHPGNPGGGLQGANENKTVFGAAFDEKIQEPMDPVVEINITQVS